MDYDITIDPPESGIIGYNIDQVNDNKVIASSTPHNIYFIQTGTVLVGATDTINEVTTWQEFTIE